MYEHGIFKLYIFLRQFYKTTDDARYVDDPYAINLVDIIDYKMCDIKVVVNSGKFTLAQKIVDRVISTIRNAFGFQDDDKLDYNNIIQMLDYNNIRQ